MRTPIGGSPQPHLLLCLGLASSFCVGNACAEQPIRVEGVRQLFIDDQVIAKLHNIQLNLHQPKKIPGNPVLRAEHPWESKGVAIYGTALYDEQEELFKIWYRAIDDTCYACYAVSHDGMQWKKPILNAKPHKGSTENNIVLGGVGPKFYLDGFAVIKDLDDPAPSRRYKMLAYNGGRRFAAMVSPDGIHWSGPVNAPEPHDTGDVVSMYYDSGLRQYVALLKRRWVSKGVEGKSVRKRARMTSYSLDFVHWSEPQWALTPDDQDHPSTEFYSHVAFMYEGMRIGYVSNFLAATERIDAQLCYSRDGLQWRRYRQRTPFLPNGPEGSFDAGMLIADASGLIVRDGKIWIYYCGFSADHAGRVRGDGPRQSGIGLAHLRLDGFVSADAGPAGGWLLTKPLLCSGAVLRINADASAGQIRGELLDARGTPIAGHDLDSAVPFSGDSVDARLQWKSQRRGLGAHDAISVRFHLKNAKLYSFWLADR